MHAVPVQAHKARDEQFVALLALVLARCRDATGRAAGPVVGGGRGLDEVCDGVVEEHCVAGGTVDDTVENMGYDFAL